MNLASGGQDILKAINQVRGLFEQVGLLLQSVESSMKERSWEPKAGNTCLAGMSYTLYAPRNWLPYVAFRFFIHKSFPSKLAAISVILDDDSGEGRVVEPLATGIVFDYGEGRDIQEDWLYAYANWHTYMPEYTPNRSNDGTVLVCRPLTDWKDDNCKAVGAASFAVPLVDIVDARSLLDRVVDPLDRLARTATASHL